MFYCCVLFVVLFCGLLLAVFFVACCFVVGACGWLFVCSCLSFVVWFPCLCVDLVCVMFCLLYSYVAGCLLSFVVVCFVLLFGD